MAKNTKPTVAAPKRYYYKAKSGNGLLNFKHPLTEEELKDYVEITEEEFVALQPKPHEPTAEELARKEKINRISTLKGELAKTDYVVLKLAEALAEGDTATVSAIESDYAEVLAARKSARAEINQLESEL